MGLWVHTSAPLPKRPGLAVAQVRDPCRTDGKVPVLQVNRRAGLDSCAWREAPGCDAHGSDALDVTLTTGERFHRYIENAVPGATTVPALTRSLRAK